ncbi:TPA: hypothetical protein HA344_00380 [Candidatus Bathyarchaeota archaeon]|nr:hypothetical protein [Candidatus Bathyarchaeota archaeon]
MFKRLFGGNQDDPKRQAEERIRGARYGRLILWIKNSHRNHFNEYQPVFDEKNQLNQIMDNLVAKGEIDYKTATSFKAYLASTQYDDLVKVR